MAFVGDPPLFRPAADEVHISVTFTWDLKEGHRLKEAWGQYYPIVKIGGPAISKSFDEFIPGKYIKTGVTFTSRGCIKKCPWCLVPPREGKIKLLEIKPGWIIQDNNFLATSLSHQEKVYSMLRSQNIPAKFSGGIDISLLNDQNIELMKTIKIKELFIAADTKGSLKRLRTAWDKLYWLGKNKLYCYTMIGFNGETLSEAEERLREVWKIGFTPFSQLYQPPDKFINYPTEWKTLNRNWSRPAIIRSKNNGN